LDLADEPIKGRRGRRILDDRVVDPDSTCVTMPIWKVAE